MNAPCKECKDRHVGCHGKCERYSTWTEESRMDNLKKRIWLGRTDTREPIRVVKTLDRIKMYGDQETKAMYGAYNKTTYKRA